MRFPVVGELVKFPGSVSAGEVLNHKGHEDTKEKLKAEPSWYFVSLVVKALRRLKDETDSYRRTRDEKIRRLAGNVHLLPPMPTEHAVADSVFSPAIVTRPLS